MAPTSDVTLTVRIDPGQAAAVLTRFADLLDELCGKVREAANDIENMG